MTPNRKTAEEWFALAIQYYGQQRYRQGRYAHQQVRRLAPGGFHDSILGAMQLFLSDRFEEALYSYERALAERPNSSLAHAHRAVVLMCLQRDEEALEAFELSLRLDPDNPVALTQLGNVYLFLKRYDEALQLSNQVLAKDPTEILPVLRVKTTALYNLSRYDEVLAGAERVIGLAPAKVFGYAAKADALEQLGRLDEALVAFERALRYAPDNAVLWTRMAGVLLRLGLAGDALVAYERALRIEGEDLASHNGKGVALMELGRLAEALEVFDRALLLHPGSQVLQSNRELTLEASIPADGKPGSEKRRAVGIWALVRLAGVCALAVCIALILLFRPDLRPVLRALLAGPLHPLEAAAIPLYPLVCWFGWRHRRTYGFNARVLRVSPFSGLPTPRYVWRRPGPEGFWLRFFRANLVGALYLLVYASLLQICVLLLRVRADPFTTSILAAENLLFLLHTLVLILTGFLYCVWPLIAGAGRGLVRFSAPAWRRWFRPRMAAGERE